MARSAVTVQPFRIPAPEELLPVYLLYGEEDFLADEAVRGLLEAAVAPEERGFNLDVVQGPDADGRDIVARASAFPMMAGRRAVLVREADKLPARDQEILAGYVERPSPSTMLVLTAGKPDMRRKLFAAVRKGGGAVEFKPLAEAQLPPWIGRRVQDRGKTIDPEASRLLSSLVGRSLRELDQEVEKLVIYAGTRPNITTDDVAAVAGVSRQFNIFELQRAIASGEVARAEEILGRMLEAGNGAPYFVVMLAGFFAAVWRIHDLRRRGLGETAIAADLKKERWALNDHFAALERYGPAQVERALALLLEVDERSKLGGDDAVLLQTLLAALMATGAAVS